MSPCTLGLLPEPWNVLAEPAAREVGMWEGRMIGKAGRPVLDTQSPNDPSPFQRAGLENREAAHAMVRVEATRLHLHPPSCSLTSIGNTWGSDIRQAGLVFTNKQGVKGS
ncbi:hypothetical protein VP1G_11357 [Cytospora mali]|uniref:Uncharacterized protein n=1 Tax=Cytospora mali TaxID=578113 RepID=A0A194VBQ8_CYTMA|nr:hypothetical protein VP1G_11357 [Valsa mali var. pyri (nom. inval.)]